MLQIGNETESSLDVTVLQDSSPETARLEVDYADAEQVFEVVVRRVPRRWLEVAPGHVVATVAGTPLALLSVALGVRVEVTLDAHGRPPHESDVAWSLDPIGFGLRMSVRDDVGTTYTFSSGEEGGSEHPWRVRRCFLPAVPSDATRLTVEVTTERGDAVSVDLPLG